MKIQKTIYLYPLTSESLKEQNNSYVRQLIAHLDGDFTVINRSTNRGLVDAAAKFFKTDIYYFNWIENLPTNRFGHMQVVLLAVLLVFCKLFSKKVVWFVHNNIAHSKTHYRTRKIIVWLMAFFADLVLSHSAEVTVRVPQRKWHVFHHPIEAYQPLQLPEPFKYDLLIWGAVAPYKGVAEFIEYIATQPALADCKILVAGKFQSKEYYERCLRSSSANISLVNEFLSEERLITLFSQSKYVLFTYSSNSVLSSAALCKTLSFGKEVIAPNIGSFKELGSRKFLYTYASFSELDGLLKNLEYNERTHIDKLALYDYIRDTSWPNFTAFIREQINELYGKRTQTSFKPDRQLASSELGK